MKIENDIVLILNEQIAGELRDCNRKFSPIEACGLIFGEITKVVVDDDKGKIHYSGKQFYCLK